MKSHRWLTINMALSLALVMLWAGPTLAQGRNQGQVGQGSQGCGQGQGQGAGNNTCPAYPAYQGSQGGQGTWCTNPQGNTAGRGRRGGGRAYQPNTQVPAATQ